MTTFNNTRLSPRDSGPGAHRLAETNLEALIQLNATLRKIAFRLDDLVVAVQVKATEDRG